MGLNLNPENVSKVIDKIKGLLEGEFREILVVGEITNLSLSSGGHWYFSLSDRNSTISCALFKMSAYQNPIIKKLKDGDKVVCIGSIGVYARRGTFQIIVKRILPHGKGDLKEQFEKLKLKLASENLFDLESKKAIPTLPERVAIITSARGAALQDFIDIYKRRCLWMDILVVPATVQGENAPKTLIDALSKILVFSNKKRVDVIVFARGGGSLEDLWAFNDEKLARSIFQCPIPVISAVGHQVDYVISDYVADLRCETPSAAAEVLTARQMQLKEDLRISKRSLTRAMEFNLISLKNRVEKNGPRKILNQILIKFQEYQKRLNRCDIRNRLYELTNIHEKHLMLDEIFQRLKLSVSEKHKHLQLHLDKLFHMLRVLDPQNVLNRGYSFLTDDKGHVVGSNKGFKKVISGSELDISFKDGKGKVIKK